MGYFRFFLHTQDFFTALYPTICSEKKNLNYYLLKVKKCHGDSVKNEIARAKKLEPV